jgi:ribosome biogenesis GTPase
LKYKNCKYNDCLHKDEPGCDVKSAVDKGLIAESRYKNYLELFSDLNSV